MQHLKSATVTHSNDCRYATFVELAGVELVDSAAKDAGLPDIDSISMVAYLSNQSVAAPRYIMAVNPLHRKIKSPVLLPQDGVASRFERAATRADS